MPTSRVRISDGEAVVHYDLTGDGPGVVLVHGTAASREQWSPLTAELAGRFTVVAPDYSGSGATTDHGGPVTLADLADEVLAAANAAGLDTFHLVGHSLGAVVAARLAALRPSGSGRWCCMLAGPTPTPGCRPSSGTGARCYIPIRSTGPRCLRGCCR